MAKRTGSTNPYLQQLIENLKKRSFEIKAPIWRDVAEKLSKPARQKVEVNISDIERHVNDGETVIVPGVVLATGTLSKKVNVVAWKFSPASKQKIENAGGGCLTIEQLVEKNPKGSNVRIIS